MRREFFDRVCAGESLREAGRQVGVSIQTGWSWWHDAGSMQLRSGTGSDTGLAEPGDLTRPGARGHRLSFDERLVIMRGLDKGLTQVEIADELDRDASVISRELKRNRNPDGDYHAGLAHARAAKKAKRPKAFKLQDRALCEAIEDWMDQGWSPKLIADVLARDHPDDRLARVSHETIYQCLYVQTRGQLRADLSKRLSTKRAARKSRDHTERRGKFHDVFTISDRPAEAADRAVPGHWEGDLIVGPNSAIGTLVERSTRFTMLLHLPGDHTAETVAGAMIEAMRQLPEHLRRSITWDRGSEMARWRDIHLQLNTPVYFCNPHSPWQRGTNENTNRLLRFWFEKGSDLSGYTPADLKRIQDTLNRRPRPTLDLDTPAQRLAALLDQAA
ncbi:IS30 family transposase [Mycobacterium intracellulare subsp. chimaera]|nr:IS30 family transposase [Mycobacterium intracellulare]ASW99393.1 IS30 family transposase [Mycobacterium intracellulare subsp. chimaera]ASW99595.1 IS30 family transposase [Mycobacterium intracellulare subsp. chimaera]ASX00177.1 IS30 family transposase [Mycobacterium intracellulare subsp. chimaera]ASX01149.1 IS30 family transposase [Mycobacterium intracellulare subsp. chimaera]ASX01151.1 IS30 family transposase [Mycobacterium intracellulare subsp. chimaera]